MCNIWTGDEVTGQPPCPWRSSFIWVSGALPGLEELCMFWSDISQDWEVWIGWTVCWKTWKPFLCPAWYGPLTQGYSVQSVNQSVPEASHSGQMSSRWFSARPWRTPSPRWCLMDEGPLTWTGTKAFRKASCCALMSLVKPSVCWDGWSPHNCPLTQESRSRWLCLCLCRCYSSGCHCPDKRNQLLKKHACQNICLWNKSFYRCPRLTSVTIAKA